MKALFLTKLAPFPPRGGENIRSYGLIKILSNVFDEVVAITGNSDKTVYADYNFVNVIFFEYKFPNDYSDKFLRRNVGRFRCKPDLLQLIRNILEKHPADVVFIDYLYYGQYIPMFKKAGLPVIYGTHNVQSRLDYQMPAISFRNRVSLILDYFFNILHERYFFRQADALIAVSEPDIKTYERYIQKDRLFLIPNFVDEADYFKADIKKDKYVIMTGNFSAYQNRAGLQWFLSNVWNDEKFRNYRLVLAGIDSDKALKNSDTGTGNVTGLGIVDDLRPHIAAASVAIVPLMHGSGTRLKCIESMALRTQLISTAKGAEGIDHEDSIVIADSPELFRTKLLEILEGKIDNTEKAYRIFRDKYCLEPNIAVFRKIVRKVTGKE